MVGFGVVGRIALALGVEALFQAIDALEESFEHVCLGTPLLGNSIWRRGSDGWVM